jgi:hypothetical protein
MANQSEAHSKLVNQTLLEIGKRFPSVVVWKNHTGMAYTPGSVLEVIKFLIAKIFNGNVDGETTVFTMAKNLLVPVKFGQKGQCDISGIIKPSGRRLEIEVKTGTGRLSKDQQDYRNMITMYGGLHIELRDLKDLDVINQMEIV